MDKKNVKTKFIIARVTEQQHQQFHAAAAEAGYKSAGDLLRELAIKWLEKG
jgi:hypothetical protein